MTHTGFGGVSYAMAIICIRLDADAKLVLDTPQPSTLLYRVSDEEAHKMGVTGIYLALPEFLCVVQRVNQMLTVL